MGILEGSEDLKDRKVVSFIPATAEMLVEKSDGSGAQWFQMWMTPAGGLKLKPKQQEKSDGPDQLTPPKKTDPAMRWAGTDQFAGLQP